MISISCFMFIFDSLTNINEYQRIFFYLCLCELLLDIQLPILRLVLAQTLQGQLCVMSFSFISFSWQPSLFLQLSPNQILNGGTAQNTKSTLTHVPVIRLLLLSLSCTQVYCIELRLLIDFTSTILILMTPSVSPLLLTVCVMSVQITTLFNSETCASTLSHVVMLMLILMQFFMLYS